MTLYRVVSYIFRPGEQTMFGLNPGWCIMSLRGCSGAEYALALRHNRVHKLKTVEPFFSEIMAGRKVHELRRDDRDFQVYDVLELVRFVPEEAFEQEERWVPCRFCESVSLGPRDEACPACSTPKTEKVPA